MLSFSTFFFSRLDKWISFGFTLGFVERLKERAQTPKIHFGLLIGEPPRVSENFGNRM